MAGCKVGVVARCLVEGDDGAVVRRVVLERYREGRPPGVHHQRTRRRRMGSRQALLAVTAHNINGGQRVFLS